MRVGPPVARTVEPGEAGSSTRSCQGLEGTPAGAAGAIAGGGRKRVAVGRRGDGENAECGVGAGEGDGDRRQGTGIPIPVKALLIAGLKAQNFSFHPQ